jgi:hypothetical protein
VNLFFYLVEDSSMTKELADMKDREIDAEASAHVPTNETVGRRWVGNFVSESR